MRSLHLAIDLDDVVLDFMPGVMDAFCREYGERPEFDGSWGAKTQEFYKHPLLLESGYSSWWDWLRDREWLWARMPAVPGAIGGIKRLRAAGHYVECVTSKPEWAEHNVWKWLGRWRPAFHRVTIITNGQRKVDFTEAEVMVDDKLETCREFVIAGRRALWFTQDASSGGLCAPISVHNWDYVVRCVRMFAEET